MKPNHLFINRADIKKIVKTVDSGGFPVETFSFSEKIKCLIQPLKSNEDKKGGRLYSQPVYKLFCDNNTNVDMDDRIFYDNKSFNIVEKNIYPNVYMELVIEKTD